LISDARFVEANTMIPSLLEALRDWVVDIQAALNAELTEINSNSDSLLGEARLLLTRLPCFG
jgi:hypothetical protein